MFRIVDYIITIKKIIRVTKSKHVSAKKKEILHICVCNKKKVIKEKL